MVAKLGIQIQTNTSTADVGEMPVGGFLLFALVWICLG